MIRVFLNTVDISNTCEVDLSFVEKLDMELDEAFLVLGHTNRANPYEMFSVVDIFENNTLLFSGRVSQDNVELSSFYDEIYNHRITLIEHTKLLEKFIITGKSFTQPLPETDESPYTLLDVVEILQKTTPLELVGLEDFIQPFKIPQETENLLDGVISPEFNFKDINLREALNEVFFYLNGIARVDRKGDVYIERFNDLKNEIDFVTENYKKDQNIANYSTMMSTDILNSVNTEVGFAEYNAEFYPGRDLWTTPRSDTLSQFDFERSFVPTPKPIYQVENLFTKIEVVATEDSTAAGGTITTLIDDDDYTVDLRRSIVEKAVYDSLGDEFTTNFLEETKRNTIYYRYGTRNIFIGGTFGLFDVSLAYRRAVERSVVLQLFDEDILPQEYIDFLQSEPDPENLPDTVYNVTVNFKGSNNPLERWNEIFRVKYTPITPSIRYEVARDDVSEIFIDTKSISNQKLRIVDLERFTNNMKGRINQLGSSELILSHKVSNIGDSYNIGDFTEEKFVITKKEVIVQRDHYIINYQLNKNFNKMSQFMGIDQEIRQFEVGERGRTIDRDLNYNEYVEIFSVNDNTVNTQNNSLTLINPDIILNSFNQSYPGILFTKYAIMKSPELVDEDTNEQIEVLMPIYKVSGGNAFGFYMDFETNTSGGDQLVQGDNNGWFNFESLRRYNLPFKYTDKIGRLDTINLRLFRQGFLEGTFEEEATFGNQLPVFSKDSSAYFVDVEGDFYVKKDNRERLKFTLLYHLLPKNVGDVVIGQKLATHNPYFLEENIELNLRLWTSDKIFTTRDNNSKLTDQDTLITTPNITIDFNNNFIEVNNSLSGVKAWSITDSDGYPLVMVNSNNKRLVFDYRNKRSNVQYNIYGIEIFQPIKESIFFQTSVDGFQTLPAASGVQSSFNISVSVVGLSEKQESSGIQDSFNISIQANGGPDLEFLAGITDSFSVSATTTGEQSFLYDITFNPNGGTWSDNTTTNKVVVGVEPGTIISNAPLNISRVNHDFVEWLPNLPYTVGNSNDTLFAQWQLNVVNYTVDARASGASPTNVSIRAYNSTYDQTFTGLLTSSYSTKHTVPGEYSIDLSTPSSFTQSGVTYTFLSWQVNGVTYSTNNRTITGISQNSQIQLNYSSGGGFE